VGSLLKSFLLDEGKLLRGNRDGRAVYLAAFGKHPGWDDHIEDLGLSTESLITAKRVLYVQGIGGQVNNRWGGLINDQLCPGFGHVWFWQRGERFLVGRLWSSNDGKGRSEYPMVVSCHCVGLSLGWALRNLLPRLAEIETASGRIVSAAEIRALLARHQAALDRTIEIMDGPRVGCPRDEGPGRDELLDAVLHETGEEGMLRLMYEMETKLGAFSSGRSEGRSSEPSFAVHHFRLPSLATEPDYTLLFWSVFMKRYVGPDIPFLCLLPIGGSWTDIIVGEPSVNEFLCLRASRAAIPVSSDIPYRLTPEFIDRAQNWLSELREATTVIEARRGSQGGDSVSPSATPFPAGSAVVPGDHDRKRRLWVALAILFLAIVLGWLWHHAGNTKADNNPDSAQIEPGASDGVD
jgi:hypothetical protein